MINLRLSIIIVLSVTCLIICSGADIFVTSFWEKRKKNILLLEKPKPATVNIKVEDVQTESFFNLQILKYQSNCVFAKRQNIGCMVIYCCVQIKLCRNHTRKYEGSILKLRPIQITKYSVTCSLKHQKILFLERHHSFIKNSFKY